MCLAHDCMHGGQSLDAATCKHGFIYLTEGLFDRYRHVGPRKDMTRHMVWCDWQYFFFEENNGGGGTISPHLIGSIE